MTVGAAAAFTNADATAKVASEARSADPRIQLKVRSRCRRSYGVVVGQIQNPFLFTIE